MYISTETQEQIENRLKKVIQTADLKIYESEYYFKEVPVGKFQFEEQALAIVRDEEVWSFLIPSKNAGSEDFKLFSFHFKDGLDNSGFVGWLASKIKNELGTGVFIVCGQNTDKGGIFDYWGCPIEIADKVIKLVRRLRE
jgi:Family of unknown function (DUF6196)